MKQFGIKTGLSLALALGLLPWTLHAQTNPTPSGKPKPAEAKVKVIKTASSSMARGIEKGAGTEAVDARYLKTCVTRLNRGIKWAEKGRRDMGQHKGLIGETQSVIGLLEACIKDPAKCPKSTAIIAKGLNCKAKENRGIVVALSEQELKAQNLQEAIQKVNGATGNIYYAEVEGSEMVTKTQCTVEAPPAEDFEINAEGSEAYKKDNEWAVSDGLKDSLKEVFAAYDAAGYNLVSATIEASASWRKNLGAAKNLNFYELSKKRAESVEAVLKEIANAEGVWMPETRVSLNYNGDGTYKNKAGQVVPTGARGENPYEGNPTPDEIRDGPEGQKRKEGYAHKSEKDNALRVNQYTKLTLRFEPCLVCLEQKLCKEETETVTQAQALIKTFELKNGKRTWNCCRLDIKINIRQYWEKIGTQWDMKWKTWKEKRKQRRIKRLKNKAKKNCLKLEKAGGPTCCDL